MITAEIMKTNSIAVICIIATEFCERFSFCGLRTILSLYLRNILCLHENSATTVYHVFIMLCYTMPLAGAVLADNFIGRYNVILYFSLVYLIGTMFACCSSMPPVCSSPMYFSLVGLVLIATGTGGIKPCVAAFGGDQFRLPEENDALQRFFSVFYCVVNLGGLLGMVVTPALRKSVSCFGDDTCYALGFGFSSVLMLVSIGILICGRRWYKIKMPKNHLTLQFFTCAWYAFCQKLKHRTSKHGSPPEHWLDYAQERCGKDFADDMKVVFSIMRLYLPVPLFWSLFDQQGSRWTFQVSRLRGEIGGITLMPDQLQVMNPLMVLLMIPLCPGGVWTPLPNIPPLDKMFAGGLLASLSFVAAGMLQIAIERSTLQTPSRNEAGISLLNTLNCPVDVDIQGYGVETVCAHGTSVLYPLPTNMAIKVTASCGESCDKREMSQAVISEEIFLVERKFMPIVIGQSSDDTINFRYMDPNSFTKSQTGKPKLRLVYIGEPAAIENVSISIETTKKLLDTYHVSNELLRGIGESAEVRVSPGRFMWRVKSGLGQLDGEGTGTLHSGGVYVLICRERKGQLDSIALYAPNPPNELHLFWILPQYILISLAEIMFAVSGLEFSFTQAPKSMKTITLAAWYVSVAFGNLMVILIAQARIFDSQAYEFFMYALILMCGMFCFLRLSRSFQLRDQNLNDGSSIDGKQIISSKSRVISVHSMITQQSFLGYQSVTSTCRSSPELLRLISKPASNQKFSRKQYKTLQMNSAHSKIPECLKTHKTSQVPALNLAKMKNKKRKILKRSFPEVSSQNHSAIVYEYLNRQRSRSPKALRVLRDRMRVNRDATQFD